MEQVKYSLKELGQVADVTERTVRFYIKEGLLPPPIGAGPFSRYGYEHWLRLQFIRRLKEEFLPLSEIKNLLDGKTVEELDRLARQTGLVPGETAVSMTVMTSEASPADRLESLLRPGNPTRLREQLAPATLSEAAAEYQPDITEEVEAEPDDLQSFDLSYQAEEPRMRSMRAVSPPSAPGFAPPAPGAMNPMSSGVYPMSGPAPTGQMGGAGFNLKLARSQEPTVPMAQSMAFKPTAFSPAPPPPEQETDEPTGQQWERLVIAPGIELHIESSIARKNRQALKTLMEMTRRLFRQ